MTRSSFDTTAGKLALLAAGLSLLLTAGCGAPEGAIPVITGGDSAPGAARGGPSHAALTGLAECTGTDVHQQHLSRFACSVCHPAGAQYGFTTPHVFPRGTSSAGGTIVLATPSAPTTCTVACHFPMGGASKSISWDTPGPLDCTACHDTGTTLAAAHPTVSPSATRADCLGCHDTSAHAVGTGAVILVPHVSGWMDQASPAFHASSANMGLADCQQCHAQDLAGGVTGVACAQCHDQKDASGNVILPWKTNCVMCHGGANDRTGAPPKAIWGYASDALRIGAHGAHVAGSALAPPYDCSVCHVKPADALASGHIDTVTAGNAPMASLTFSGMASQGLAQGIVPAWDRGSATCTSTYCHGATVAGGTLKSPVWTAVDGSQAACGTCHGVPPPSPHPAVEVTVGWTACNPCHSATVDTAGAVIAPSAGGKHLDGLVEATGHPAAWMDTASAGFHAYAAAANVAACQDCHGKDLDGVGGTATTACAKCHDTSLPTGVASWRTNCVMCHGGSDDQTGAPPKAIWGYAGDPSRGGGTLDPVRVGAHRTHVSGTSSSGARLSRPFDCGVCHLKPGDALAAGHLDGSTATVVLAGLAAQGTRPAWVRAEATCSNTYCHGATLHGGTNTVPTWTTVNATQDACGTCHGVPPPASSGHVQNPSCGNCHPGYTQTSVNASTHVNGTVDLVGLTCTTCHGDPARVPTTLNPQLAAAPPLDTIGNGGTTSPGVGAHQAHLTDGPLGSAIACTECHAVPTSTVGHPAGTLALSWGALATKGAVPTYAGGTCSSTYCHGATLQAGGTNQTPRWTGGSAEVSCGTCHGIPPPSPHPVISAGLTACSGCHSTTVDATGAIIPAAAGGKHIDGVVQATGGHAASWMDQGSPGFHAYAANQGLGSCQGCHGPGLDGVGGITTVACAQCHDASLPVGVAGWKTNCVMCHGGTSGLTGAPPRTTWGNGGDLVRVGAHTVHVAGSAVAAPFDCAVCHVKPTEALSAGHIDGPTATVTWGGLAIAGGAVPSWNRSTAACASTYCHGNYSGVYEYWVWDYGLDQAVPASAAYAGSNATPTWTAGPMTCASCHGNPPRGTGTWHSGSHANGTIANANECQLCHPDASSTNGVGAAITNTALHANGTVDVTPAWRTACFGCH